MKPREVLVWHRMLDSPGAARSGVSIISGQDLRGLTGQESLPVGRWIGGLGHELGHTFGLPHHADCSPVWLTTCPADSLMWLGFYDYPNTYFLPEEKETLWASPFITTPRVPEPTTGILVASGLVALSIGRRRRRRETSRVRRRTPKKVRGHNA